MTRQADVNVPFGSSDGTINDEKVVTAHLADDAVTGAKLADLAYRKTTVYCAVALTVGTLLHVSGWNAANSCPVVEKADADAGKPAQLVAAEANAGGATSEARDIYTLTGQNTSAAGAVGDPVYQHTTAGGWTLSKPTAANAMAQIVGRVKVKSATVGEIVFDLARAEMAAIGSSELQADAVTGPKLAVGALKYSGFTGKNGAGACTLTGAKVGDKVAGVVNITDGGDASADFEATITVVDQIQQSAVGDLSTKKFAVLLVVKS